MFCYIVIIIYLCYHNYSSIIPTKNLRVNCSKIQADDTERSFLPKNAKPRCKLTSDAPKPTSPLICLDIHLWASSVISTFRSVNATICFNLWLGLVENPMGFEGHLVLKQFSMDVCWKGSIFQCNALKSSNWTNHLSKDLAVLRHPPAIVFHIHFHTFTGCRNRRKVPWLRAWIIVFWCVRYATRVSAWKWVKIPTSPGREARSEKEGGWGWMRLIGKFQGMENGIGI